MRLPSQARSENRDRSTNFITQLDQSYFHRYHKKSIDGRRDYRSSYVTPKLYQRECMQKIRIKSHWTGRRIRACYPVLVEYGGVSAFSAVLPSNSIHMREILWTLSFTDLVTIRSIQGSPNSARTLA